MAGKRKREMVKLKSTESTSIYYSFKNKTNTPERLELKKYCPILRRHAKFKEAK